jgi:hypothetical protein
MNQEMAISFRNARIAAHPGLDGLLPRWRPELIGRAISECKHFTMRKIVDHIVDKTIYDFRNEHALRGLDLTACDSDIVETARRRAGNVALVLSAAKEDWAAEEIIGTTCKFANVPQPKGDTLEARKKRISCMHWWRRQLRKVHARAIENGNIKLRFVQAKREPYASTDALRRCIWQEERNRLWMEATVLQNEIGDRFTLHELAELSTSNKAIRRAELMTRIRGMEDYANEFGYMALFVTITCPSYFHATLRASGLLNPQYRGKTPRQAQDYLCKVWSHVRAKFDREGVTTFGMRVAEPHHDACPHWHVIMFIKPDQAALAQSIIKHYALLDSPDEQGAQLNRCNFKEITAEQGSATGYVAKYISKNIDGYKLETDLTGEPAITASQRVTAWSKTHGIRQFQAFGAGSVTVWRELRRVPFANVEHAPEHIQTAWHAAQKTLSGEGTVERRADYAGYLKANGGAALPRKHARIKLAKLHYDTPNKYGEPLGEKPIGIYSSDAPMKIYESTRYTWMPVEVSSITPKTIEVGGKAQAQAVLKKSGFVSTWTRVNNCTRPVPKAELSELVDIQEFETDDSIFDRMRC